MADATYQHYGDHKVNRHGFAPWRMISEIFKRIQEYRKNSRAVSELRNLDDRTLNDIGITRGEIYYRVWNKDSERG